VGNNIPTVKVPTSVSSPIYPPSAPLSNMQHTNMPGTDAYNSEHEVRKAYDKADAMQNEHHPDKDMARQSANKMHKAHIARFGHNVFDPQETTI